MYFIRNSPNPSPDLCIFSRKSPQPNPDFYVFISKPAYPNPDLCVSFIRKTFHPNPKSFFYKKPTSTHANTMPFPLFFRDGILAITTSLHESGGLPLLSTLLFQKILKLQPYAIIKTPLTLSRVGFSYTHFNIKIILL